MLFRSVVAENKYEAFELYRNVKFVKSDGREIFHFSPYERDDLRMDSSEIIPLGEAYDFVPKGVIYNLDMFVEALPHTFTVPQEMPNVPTQVDENPR